MVKLSIGKFPKNNVLMSSGGVAPPRYEFYIQLKKIIINVHHSPKNIFLFLLVRGIKF